MSLDDGLSKFLGEMYEAVHEPEGWRATIAEVARRTESHRIVVETADFRRKEIVAIQFHGPEDSKVETGAREYRDGMSALDPSFDWAREHPGAGICDTAAILSEDQHRDHPFIKWCRDRMGTEHWRAFYTEPIEGLSFAVSFHSPLAAPPSRKYLPLQALLFENLERALRLAARPPKFADDDSGLIAIDSTGRPLSLSQRAEELVRETEGLRIDGSLLTAHCPSTAAQLQQAIRAAIDPSSGGRLGRGVRIARNSGKCDLLVIVSPFPPALDYLPRPRPAALVRIIELDMRRKHLTEHSHLFGLSPRETEVASALLEGHSIASMAASLGVTRNTARNHLQALFRKTGTNRQSDLVRLLDRIARQ